MMINRISWFAEIQEVAGAKDRLITGQHCFGKRALLIKLGEDQLLIFQQRFLWHELSCGEIRKTPNEPFRIFTRLF